MNLPGMLWNASYECFLLDSAAVCQDQIRAFQEVMKAFLKQIVRRRFCGSKMDIGQNSHRLPVEFFRVGRVDIIGVEAAVFTMISSF